MSFEKLMREIMPVATERRLGELRIEKNFWPIFLIPVYQSIRILMQDRESMTFQSKTPVQMKSFRLRP